MRSPDTHKAILDAAERILTREGYAGFTFDAVAKLAGSSKPTLYRWWPNKAALIMEVYERSSETRLLFADTGALETDIAALLGQLWAWWRETRAGEAFRGVIAEAQSSAAAQDELRTVFIARRREVVRVIFDRARRRGEIDDRADVDAAITCFIGMSVLHLMTGDLADGDAPGRAARVLTHGLLR
jgi:AcrR family transcriptional regulator